MDPGHKTAATSLAALASVLAAGTCCLPLGVFLAAAGTAGASAYLESVRVVLMPLSVVLLGAAFYQSYARRNQCVRRSPAGRVVLWVSAILVLTMILFPQWVALTVARVSRS